MLKLFLCIGVLTLCVFLAFLLTRKYKQRRDFYYNFSLFNERLLNEVSYARAPLPEFIGKYRFGGDFGKMLEEKRVGGFRCENYAFSYLKENERKYLADYFGMIGKSDAASQKTYLSAQRAEVEEQRRRAEEAYKKHFALYLKLGVLAGLILVILIV